MLVGIILVILSIMVAVAYLLIKQEDSKLSEIEENKVDYEIDTKLYK